MKFEQIGHFEITAQYFGTCLLNKKKMEEKLCNLKPEKFALQNYVQILVLNVPLLQCVSILSWIKYEIS